MSKRKRYPSTQLHIAMIHKGEIKQLRDLKYFEIAGEDIPRVNIFGVVVEKYDGLTQNGRKFGSITVDDSSGTIKIKVWSRPTEDEEGKVVKDPYLLLQDVNLGSLVDVVGRVREYNDEYYIDPTIVTATDDIEWEINRRIQIVQKYMETSELENQERHPLIITEPSADSNSPNSSPLDDDKTVLIDAFDDDFEKNTIEGLVLRSKLSKETVIPLIDSMKELGEIYMPRPDRYDLIPL